MTVSTRLMILAALLALFAIASCNQQTPTTPDGQTEQADDDHGHDDDHDHDHDDHAPDGGHHGNPVELGTATIEGYTIRVARDEGDITPGGEAPIDVYVTDGDLASLLAVRFWIGTGDAVGSIKARGEIEHADQPNHFHNHAMIPDPLPDGSKLWIELDIEGTGKVAVPIEMQSD